METQNGLIHIYCGDGKGKTTAALALLCGALATVNTSSLYSS